MKIGIITFHRAHNFGAVLQCYALSKHLSLMGHLVEVIDYYPNVFKEEYSQFPKTAFKKATFLNKLRILVWFVMDYPFTRKRIKVFNNFVQHTLCLSEKQYNENNHQIKGYDLIFFGSDQIWNPNLTGGFDDVFTGKFKKDNALFVSYAASTTLNFNDTNKRYFTDNYHSILTRFDFVSVRERTFADYLNNFNIHEVKTVVDPVLLLTGEQWGNIAVCPPEKKYLLVYSVPNNPRISEIAKMIASNKGLKLVEIVSNGRLLVNGHCKRIVSPELFIGYFQYADYVVTSSFHGTAFSIIFEKPFVYVMKGNSYDGRAFDLLKQLNLTERAILLDNPLIPSKEIERESVDLLLSQIKDDSKSFIISALESV